METDTFLSGASWFIADQPRQPLTPARWYAEPAKLARMDRFCALALVAADAALVDAGSPKLDPERTAIVLGTAYGCHATNEDYYRGLLREGLGGASPRLFAYTLPSSPVGEISIHYGIRGPATAATPGLHAGIAAVAEGVQHLRANRADRVIVVAAEVASDLLQTLTGGPVRDCSAAVILERNGGRARVLSVEESFTAASVERSDTLGATSLIALARWLAQPSGSIRLEAADPGGGRASLECVS